MAIKKNVPFYHEDIPEEKMKAIIKLHLEFEKVDKDTFFLYSTEKIQEFSNFITSLKGKKYTNENLYYKKLLEYILLNSIDFSSFGIPAKSLTINDLTGKMKENYISTMLDTDADIIHNLKDIFENSDFYIQFLKKAKINKTRQKGPSHFVNKVSQLFPKYLEDYETIEINKDNFLAWANTVSTDKQSKRIFVSNNDKLLTTFLSLIDKEINDLNKGIDLILVRNGDVNFAEVKEFSTNGGSQNHQYRDMISVASEEKGFAICYGGALFQRGAISNKLNLARERKIRDVIDITNGRLTEEEASQSNDIYPIENFIFYLKFLDIIEELIQEFKLDEEHTLDANTKKKIKNFLKEEDIDTLLYNTTFDEFVKTHKVPRILRGVKIGEFFENANNEQTQTKSSSSFHKPK